MPRKDDKQFDPAVVLERAMEVFWEKGYEAAGMAELVERMGIGRQSVYDTFGAKSDLYHSALQHYADVGQEPAMGALSAAGRPVERVRRLVRLWESAALDPEHRGCMLVNGCTEVGSRDEAVVKLARSSINRLEEALCVTLEEGQTAGELRSDCSPRELARTLLTVGHGLLILAKTAPSKARVRDVTDTVMRLITP